jgi:hypothetical protein
MTATHIAYEAGRHFERHRLTQLLQARLSELERITALSSPEGRASILAAEVRRIVGQLQAN